MIQFFDRIYEKNSGTKMIAQVTAWARESSLDIGDDQSIQTDRYYVDQIREFIISMGRERNIS